MEICFNPRNPIAVLTFLFLGNEKLANLDRERN
jgi:hypothetical protein